jgi:L-alanine-DL-glutamate epimerase-like enolase superfamily enzyme
MAATRNSNYYELGLLGPEFETPHAEAPVYVDGYTDAPNEVENGYVTVPDGPGLGVVYDWEYIENNRLGGRTYE